MEISDRYLRGTIFFDLSVSTTILLTRHLCEIREGINSVRDRGSLMRQERVLYIRWSVN